MLFFTIDELLPHVLLVKKDQQRHKKDSIPQAYIKYIIPVKFIDEVQPLLILLFREFQIIQNIHLSY